MAATVREAVGVFHDERSLQAAVDDLLITGFDRADLNLLGAYRTGPSELGYTYRKVAELEDDPHAPYRAYAGRDSRIEGNSALIGGLAYVGAIAAVGVVASSGGTVAAALGGAAAAGGAGALVGAAVVRIIDRRRTGKLQEQLDRGGLLLWVRCGDAECERRAGAILERHGAEDVHAHALPAIAYARDGGVSRELTWLYKPFLRKIFGA